MAVGTAVAVTAVGLLPPVAPASADPPDDQPPDSHGIHVEAWTPVDPDIFNPNDRPVYDARITTSTVFAGASAPTPIHVRIHLPADYDHDDPEGYPVLFLLHGGGSDRTSWTNGHEGNLTAALQASGYDGIVVMPDGGYSGWWRDWASNTRGGFRPLWETFLTGQLAPWVRASFKTSADPADWALAGVSMGGYGALSNAARHDELFGVVASLSGGTDLNGQPPPSGGKSATQIIDGALSLFGATVPGTSGDTYKLPGPNREDRLVQMLGPRSGWSAVNPYDLAAQGGFDPFSGSMYLYAGDDEDEVEINFWNRAFAQRLTNEGVNHIRCFGDGGHNWTAFRGQLTHLMKALAGVLPPSNPCPFGNY